MKPSGKNYNYIPGNKKADNMAYPLDLVHDKTDLHFWYLFPNVGISQFAGPGNLGDAPKVPLVAVVRPRRRHAAGTPANRRRPLVQLSEREER